MIFYFTKLTLERYKLKLPHEMAPPTNQIVESLMAKERGNELLEWGEKYSISTVENAYSLRILRANSHCS